MSIPGQECLGSYSSDNIMFTSLLSAPEGKRNDNNKGGDTKKRVIDTSVFYCGLLQKTSKTDFLDAFFSHQNKASIEL